jgi:outer membrane protein
MNKVYTVWLSLLSLVVIVLAWRSFSAAPASSVPASPRDSSFSAGHIFFIDTDSVIGGYAFAEDKQKLLEEKNLQREKQLRARQSAYEAEVKKYQKELPIMTQREQAKAEEKLMKMQQELLEMQQRFQQEALAEEQALVLMLADTLEAFMKEYARDKKIAYVLGYQRDGRLFYTNPSLNITADVLRRLNERYQR